MSFRRINLNFSLILVIFIRFLSLGCFHTIYVIFGLMASGFVVVLLFHFGLISFLILVLV